MESDKQEARITMIQEWFVMGARYAFVGFFTTFIFLVLWVFVLGIISLIAAIVGGNNGNEEP
jgi:hypothetical protein